MPCKLLALAVTMSLVAAQNQHFYSNPALSPPTLVVETNNAALTEPGYIFMSPFQDAQPSPLIFDSNGTLIWDGIAFVAPMNAHDLTVCDYQDSPHLCFVDATQENGYARGKGLILDSTYTIVDTVYSGDDEPELDQHEFFVKDNGISVLTTIYKQIPFDGAANGFPRVTWLSIGIFQEIDLLTGNVTFQWTTIDHVPVSQSYVLPGTTDISGDGLTQNTAWDYFHINSIDKDSNGDYLVSGRHVKTIFKISGADGSIIWQLGGKSSNFDMDYEFNFQHDARYRAESGSTTTISLYDNGSDDSPPPPGQTKPGYESYSSGIVAVVDTSSSTSTLTERYVSPGHQLSMSQGDLQFLPNGNKFMGMGNLPFAIEFTDNSTGNSEVVFYAHLQNSNGDTFSSYRNFKFEWSARPAAPPDLFVYAENCSSGPVVYASWNGATEVATWHFSSFNNESDFGVRHLGTVPKTGFETMAIFPNNENFVEYVVAEALDSRGRILGRTGPVKTFVPAASLASSCTAASCGTALNYTTAAQTTCTTSLNPPSPFKLPPIRGYGGFGVPRS